MKKMHANFLAWCLLELFVAVIVISLLTTLNQSALNPRGSPTWGWGWWPHLASIEAIWGVSQVPGWRLLPPKDLALQVVVAACRPADTWRVRKRGVRLPRLLAGAPAWGSGDAGCQPAALAPAGLSFLTLCS